MFGISWVSKADSNFSCIKNGLLEELANWVTFFIQKALVENEKGSVEIKVCFEAPGFIHSSKLTRSLLTNKCLIEVDKDGWSWQNYSVLADELNTSSLSIKSYRMTSQFSTRTNSSVWRFFYTRRSVDLNTAVDRLLFNTFW